MLASDFDLPMPASLILLQNAHNTIQTMKAQGHDYLDLRQDGEKIIYLCIICLTPCHNDEALILHLNRSVHKKMQRCVELTMRLQNLWPFNDGMIFFNSSKDEFHDEVGTQEASPKYSWSPAYWYDDGCSTTVLGGHLQVAEELMVPGVRLVVEVNDIRLKYLGIAEIGVRFYNAKKRKTSDKIRIWCEWLGRKTTDIDPDEPGILKLDYVVVTLKYAMGVHETEQNECRGGGKKKTRKSFSDPSVSLIEDNDASLKDSAGLSCNADVIGPGVNIPSDEHAVTGSKRERPPEAGEGFCDFCNHKMHPGKDVAALLNLKTVKLACSDTNTTGAFHVYHVSCLLHWILFSKYETFSDPAWDERLRSVLLCPACRVSKSQMNRYIERTSDGREEWMKDPEILQNCSIDLHYPPPESEEILEELTKCTLDFLPFYTIDDPQWACK